ncbi:hypothetical protein GCM10010388_01700 [Streptomyces mauvecolor]
MGRGPLRAAPDPPDSGQPAGRGWLVAQFPAPLNPFSAAGRGWLLAQFPAPLAGLMLARTGAFQPVRRLRTSALQARTGSGAEPQETMLHPSNPRRVSGRGGVGKPPRGHPAPGKWQATSLPSPGTTPRNTGASTRQIAAARAQRG